MSTSRGIRLLKALDYYKNNAIAWDAKHIFSRLEITTIGNGCISGSFVVTEELCNAAKTLHGGFSTSVVDALSIFSYMAYEQGDISWTTNMNMIYLNTASIGEIVVVKSQPVRLSKSTAVMDCLLTNKSTGKLLARGTVHLQKADAKTSSSIEKLPFNTNEL